MKWILFLVLWHPDPDIVIVQNEYVEPTACFAALETALNGLYKVEQRDGRRAATEGVDVPDARGYCVAVDVRRVVGW